MEVKRPFETPRPVLRSLMYMMIPIGMAVLSGAIISVLEMKGNAIPLVQGLFFGFALLIALMIARRAGGPLANTGFRPPEGWCPHTWLAILLLVVMLASNLLQGFRQHLTAEYVISHLAFAVIVGITEETVFRGLVFWTLRHRGLACAVLLSSLLFGIGHIFQLLSGASLLLTLLQILLAFLFGLAFALLVVKTRSLLLPILFHMAHNFTEYIRMKRGVGDEALFGGIQFLLLLLVAWVLLRSLTQEDQEAVAIDAAVQD